MHVPLKFNRLFVFFFFFLISFNYYWKTTLIADSDSVCKNLKLDILYLINRPQVLDQFYHRSLIKLFISRFIAKNFIV